MGYIESPDLPKHINSEYGKATRQMTWTSEIEAKNNLTSLRVEGKYAFMKKQKYNGKEVYVIYTT